MIDASHDYVKDGNKNRLRERDIYKIVTTFNNQITDEPKYARFVPNEEIKVKNEYNLNIPRYIDSTKAEDLQDIDAHLNGGIPAMDVDSMNNYWEKFPTLKSKLFSVMRKGYYKLNTSKDEVRNTIYTDEEFMSYSDKIDSAFEVWINNVDDNLRNIDEEIDVKKYIVWLSSLLVHEYESIELIDKYDVYEVLLLYWQEVMSDDVFLIKYDGYSAGNQTQNIYETQTKKNGENVQKYKGWEGKLIPKSIVEREYFFAERAKIDEAQGQKDSNPRHAVLESLFERHY